MFVFGLDKPTALKFDFLAKAFGSVVAIELEQTLKLELGEEEMVSMLDQLTEASNQESFSPRKYLRDVLGFRLPKGAYTKDTLQARG